MYKLAVHIEEPFQGQVEKAWLKQVAENTLSAEEVEAPAELSLVLTDDELVRELNRAYRGVDRNTDVLAFRLDGGPPDFPPPPDLTRHLGEVIISYPQAARQAEEQGHSLKKELGLLVIHGILHLLGYEDEDPQKEPRMRAREAELLSLIVKEK